MTNEITYKLSVNNRKEFFKAWVNLLQPILKIRSKEVDFLATLLEYRNAISKVLDDEDEIGILLFSTKKRKDMRDELNIDEFGFNTLLCDLRRKGLITKNSINKKVIPIITDDMNNFTLKFNINVKQ